MTPVHAVADAACWLDPAVVGVLGGAFVTGVLGLLAMWLRAVLDGRAEVRKQEFARRESRRDGRKAACMELLKETRRAIREIDRFESNHHGQRPGDLYPEEYTPDLLIDEALAAVALEMPLSVVDAASHLRDVVRCYVWGNDEARGFPTWEEVKDAESDFLEKARGVFGNE